MKRRHNNKNSSSSSAYNCLICGSSVYEDNNTSSNKRILLENKISKQNQSIFSKWKSESAKSFCTAFNLENDPYEYHFTKSNYCKQCLQQIREIDFTVRTTQRLIEKLEVLKYEVQKTLKESFEELTNIPEKRYETPDDNQTVRALVFNGITKQKLILPEIKVEVEALETSERGKSLNFQDDSNTSSSGGPTLQDNRNKRNAAIKLEQMLTSVINQSQFDDEFADINNDSSTNVEFFPPLEPGLPGDSPDNAENSIPVGISQNVELENDQKFQKLAFKASKPTCRTPKRKKYSIIRCTYPKCKTVCTTLENRTIHIRKKHLGDATPFQCSNCPKKFSMKSKLADHMVCHCEIRPFICEACGKSFRQKNSLKMHLKSKMHAESDRNTLKTLEGVPSSPTTYSCVLCSKVFESDILLDEHKQLHLNSATPFQCLDCNQIYTNSFDLKYHQKEQHPTPASADVQSFKCDICSRTLMSGGTLRAHKKLRHEVKLGKLWRFPCNLCEAKFYFKAHLIQHKQEKHPEDETVPPIKLYPCPFCSKTFEWKSGLTRHLGIHTEDKDKPFHCKVCNKGFVGQNDLKSHEEIHSGIRAHICPDCGKSFVTRNNYYHHRQQHTGTGKYNLDKMRKPTKRTNKINLLNTSATEPSSAVIS